jgi:hypothetical protein
VCCWYGVLADDALNGLGNEEEEDDSEEEDKAALQQKAGSNDDDSQDGKPFISPTQKVNLI